MLFKRRRKSRGHDLGTSFRALIADDHPMCREAAKLAVKAVVPGASVKEAASLRELVGMTDPAEIIILDLGLPDSRGLASLIDVMRARPATPILVVSGSENPEIEQRVAMLGAAGFVSKAAPITDIIDGVRAIIGGGKAFRIPIPVVDGTLRLAEETDRLTKLTRAESRVLRAMSDGRMNKRIAFDLELSEITVKQHVKAILRKLEVLNRTQAVLIYHQASR